MPTHNIAVIGASAGGMSALETLVKEFPQDFPAALFIVRHVAPQAHNILPTVLNRASRLPAALAQDKEAIRPGHIYVAPADHHLLVEAGYVRVTRGPKENRFRPAVDPLFRSAAYAYGPRVIGVVLTGSLDDGTAGLWAIKDRGGLAVVQDPQEAEFPSMPRSALRYVAVDYCVPLADMAPLLVRLSREPVAPEERYPVSDELKLETRVALEGSVPEMDALHLGDLSPFTCPECHGVLVKLQNGQLVRFRCHTGHAFSPQSLLEALTESVEAELWNSLRALQEHVLLLRHLAQHLSEPDRLTAEQFLQKAEEVQTQVEKVRQTMLQEAGGGEKAHGT